MRMKLHGYAMPPVHHWTDRASTIFLQEESEGRLVFPLIDTSMMRGLVTIYGFSALRMHAFMESKTPFGIEGHVLISCDLKTRANDQAANDTFINRHSLTAYPVSTDTYQCLDDDDDRALWEMIGSC